MTLRSFLQLFSTRAAALVVSLGCVGTAGAADVAPPISAAPTAVPADVCPTCNGAAPSGCKTCGKACHGIFPHSRKPYVTHLCPGACFGYFQTQWHQWENVCPIPYQGVGQSDAPVRPTPSVAGPGLTPQPTDPKVKGSDQPLPKPMPVPPGTLPIPSVPDKSKM
ncbi:MAG: hypothetical protein JWO38_390 [Gemmataceae bacterium]|nr:hypothetical protein [Gemmataceae bacterium]